MSTTKILRVEGPFGDHTGVYSPADRYPTFHVKCMTHRRKPIYAATVVGKPPMEDAWLGKATERIFLPLLQAMLPEVVDMNLPVEGGFHNLAIVSIRKSYPGQAKKVMNALWGLGHMMMLTRVLIVVDADVDVQDPRARRVVRAEQSGARARRRDDARARSTISTTDRTASHTARRSASTQRARTPRKVTRASGRRRWLWTMRRCGSSRERWRAYGLDRIERRAAARRLVWARPASALLAVDAA